MKLCSAFFALLCVFAVKKEELTARYAKFPQRTQGTISCRLRYTVTFWTCRKNLTASSVITRCSIPAFVGVDTKAGMKQRAMTVFRELYKITALADKNYMFSIFLAQRYKGHKVEKHQPLCSSCLCAKQIENYLIKARA